MPVPLEDLVRAVLIENDRGPKLHRAISDAWTTFAEVYPDRPRWRRKATRRNVFWEVAAEAIIAAVADDPGVRIIEHRDTVSILINDEVLLRLKHADRSLTTQNVPTGEAVQYDDHEIDLFGLSGIQRVRLCYVLDRYETEIAWIGIAAHFRGSFLWRIQLESDSIVQAEPMIFEDAPTTDVRHLIRAKKPTDTETRDRDDKAEGNG